MVCVALRMSRRIGPSASASSAIERGIVWQFFKRHASRAGLTWQMRRTFILAITLSATLSVQPAPIGAHAPEKGSDPLVAHVLNRVAFGARTGDEERVSAMDEMQYGDVKLHAERHATTEKPVRL